MMTFSVFPLPLLKLNEGSLQCFKKKQLLGIPQEQSTALKCMKD